MLEKRTPKWFNCLVETSQSDPAEAEPQPNGGPVIDLLAILEHDLDPAELTPFYDVNGRAKINAHHFPRLNVTNPEISFQTGWKRLPESEQAAVKRRYRLIYIYEGQDSRRLLVDLMIGDKSTSLDLQILADGHDGYRLEDARYWRRAQPYELDEQHAAWLEETTIQAIIDFGPRTT